MPRPPVLIIGSSGQVARSLKEELVRTGSPVWTTSRNPKAGDSSQFFLDLGNKKSIEDFFAGFAKKFPGISTDVYLPGAMTHVDRCEQEQALCRALNVTGPLAVALECQKAGYRLCYYSSEYIFGEEEYHGGAIGPFSEVDAPAPSSFYGKSKLDSENALLALQPQLNVLIIRTTMVFSYEPEGMNFVMQVLRQLERWKNKDYSQSFRVPQDQISTPSYALGLAQASLQLMQKKCSGIYNVVGKDLVSRKEFIERIIAEFSYPPETLQAFQFLDTKELKQVARRPLTAGLTTTKAAAAGVRIWSLAEAFQDFKQERKKNP